MKPGDTRIFFGIDKDGVWTKTRRVSSVTARTWKYVGKNGSEVRGDTQANHAGSIAGVVRKLVEALCSDGCYSMFGGAPKATTDEILVDFAHILRFVAKLRKRGLIK